MRRVIAIQHFRHAHFSSSFYRGVLCLCWINDFKSANDFLIRQNLQDGPKSKPAYYSKNFCLLPTNFHNRNASRICSMYLNIAKNVSKSAKNHFEFDWVLLSQIDSNVPPHLKLLLPIFFMFTVYIIPSMFIRRKLIQCKQNHDNMQDRKVMQDSYNCPKNLN